MAVRWYVAYALSYRDIEEMMAERGIKVDHATVNLWVVKYAPLLEARLALLQINQQHQNIVSDCAPLSC